MKVDGWFPREQAIEVIEEAQKRYRENGDDAQDDAEAAGEGDADETG